MKKHAIRFSLAITATLIANGCGGVPADSFANSIYVQITTAAVFQPASTPLPNGYKIVFINNDSIVHSVNWNSPLTLTVNINPGDRAWFELPPNLAGTVLSYHLDASGPNGSVTVVNLQ